jgi:thiosulfate/3-mercaptopyruvate sulfurtransferase
MRFARHRAKLQIMPFRSLIDAAALQGLLGTARLAIIDCRFDLMKPEAGRQDFLRAHIPGARYADLNRDLSAPVTARTGRHPLPAPEAFAGRLAQLGIANDSQVVAYDEASGAFAARLWWMLRWLGHDAVAVLDGGFQAWTRLRLPLQSGEPSETDASVAAAPVPPFVPRLRAAAVTTAELERALFPSAPLSPAPLSPAPLSSAPLPPKPLLVDARAPERFAGTVEPIDPVAGHVPGAVNHPFSTSLAADNRFLPPAELRARWLERLAGTAPENLIAMCGSGVTACHNLLSLEVAGLPGGKLYAGSWSEWIRDPRRPIARG